jgi:hypothetical protein
MLDAFVIEEIRKRERERGREDRPGIQIPLPAPDAPSSDPRPPDSPPPGEVIIIDYG